MRQPFINIYFFCILALFYNFFSGSVAAQSEKDFPLMKCWEINVENINKTQIASDKVSQVFYFHGNGLIGSIGVTDGRQRWNTELGGQILDSSYDNQILYVVSANETENAMNSSANIGKSIGNNNSKVFRVRAISTETGIVKWQSVFNLPSEQSLQAYIAQDSVYLYIVSSQGEITKISKNEGRVLETFKVQETITTRPSLYRGQIIFGTQNSKVYVFSTEGSQLKQVVTENVPTEIAVTNDKLIVGDMVGKLSAYGLFSGDKLWQTRMGAGISNITEFEESQSQFIAVSSNDNFIYLISIHNGEKIWKKRLAGRNTTVRFPLTESLLSVELNGINAVFVELKKGKTNNQLVIDSPDFFVDKPIVLGESIVFQTKNKLIGYSSKACPETKEPAVSPAL